VIVVTTEKDWFRARPWGILLGCLTLIATGLFSFIYVSILNDGGKDQDDLELTDLQAN